MPCNDPRPSFRLSHLGNNSRAHVDDCDGKLTTTLIPAMRPFPIQTQRAMRCVRERHLQSRHGPI
eukprot:6293889-Prorocentrum_lima.AAC.1